MFGCHVRLPVDLMFGTSSPELQYIPGYVKLLQHTLQKAPKLVRDMSSRAYQTKMLYDRRVHGKVYQFVTPWGKSRKLHIPWSGPFWVKEILGESIYKIRSPTGGKPKIIIHFDRPKPFPLGADVGQRILNSETVEKRSATTVPSYSNFKV